MELGSSGRCRFVPRLICIVTSGAFRGVLRHRAPPASSAIVSVPPLFSPATPPFSVPPSPTLDGIGPPRERRPLGGRPVARSLAVRSSSVRLNREFFIAVRPFAAPTTATLSPSTCDGRQFSQEISAATRKRVRWKSCRKQLYRGCAQKTIDAPASFQYCLQSNANSLQNCCVSPITCNDRCVSHLKPYC